jgi:hypothetical protein
MMRGGAKPPHDRASLLVGQAAMAAKGPSQRVVNRSRPNSITARAGPDGPHDAAMISTAITSQPEPTGPDWFGKVATGAPPNR